MKKIFDKRVLVQIDDCPKWKETTIWSHLHYIEEDETYKAKIYDLDTFDKAFEFVENGKIPNAFTDSTFFKSRPRINIHIADLDYYNTEVRYTEKNFKPFKVCVMYEEKNYVNLRTLLENLDAKEFCDYIKENC